MKITESQLRRIIHQEVQNLNEMPRRAIRTAPTPPSPALATANEVLGLMQKIKDKLQVVFPDDDQWMEVESHIDAAYELIAQKHF